MHIFCLNYSNDEISQLIRDAHLWLKQVDWSYEMRRLNRNLYKFAFESQSDHCETFFFDFQIRRTKKEFPYEIDVKNQIDATLCYAPDTFIDDHLFLKNIENNYGRFNVNWTYLHWGNDNDKGLSRVYFKNDFDKVEFALKYL